MYRPSYTSFAKGTLFAGAIGMSYYHMKNNFSQMAHCQAGITDFNDYGGRLQTLNHIGAVKHLMSYLRDKNSNTVTFRHYSDRIMRLLVEEALS